MSQLRAVCDGCGELAPIGYSHTIPTASGWLTVNWDDRDGWDVCSWECLAKLAAENVAAGTPITSSWRDLAKNTARLEALLDGGES